MRACHRSQDKGEWTKALSSRGRRAPDGALGRMNFRSRKKRFLVIGISPRESRFIMAPGACKQSVNVTLKVWFPSVRSVTQITLEFGFSIKLELHVQIQAFSFTFETSTPGPITVEITIRKSLKRSRSQTIEATDSTDMETQRPEFQLVNTQALLTEAIKANLDAKASADEVIDNSVTGARIATRATSTASGCIRLRRQAAYQCVGHVRSLIHVLTHVRKELQRVPVKTPRFLSLPQNDDDRNYDAQHGLWGWLVGTEIRVGRWRWLMFILSTLLHAACSKSRRRAEEIIALRQLWQCLVPDVQWGYMGLEHRWGVSEAGLETRTWPSRVLEDTTKGQGASGGG
ncbi:hypothetical protein DFJ58DRAFT_839510 [Suillus subalutaceus]|uniref:uncharacterized protein n=1 Tax=Suillus subalutaceus TaxID=48586 RepID=UPI001B87CF7E|nr:uncharacterized protein DFJ58DRAFT_839510 [Suillus subalutaceus]KAG1862090.1 hypothetical protein DFJ58DRAFT_839510 [Suillus subalutaceus]